LSLEELADPEPGPGEVLVRVAGAGVGPWDVKLRQGLFGPRPFPYVPGAELAGTVEAVGPGVDGIEPGQRVIGNPGFSGGYAELAVVSVSKVTPAPAGIDLVEAGAVPVGGGTAVEGLDDHLALAAGERLLVAGAAGGVGTFVVQIAKARGAHVIATASPTNHDFLRSIGADEVVDYHGDWVGEVLGVDAAFDCVGGGTWQQCLDAVREGGRGVTILPGSPGNVEGREVRTASFSASMTARHLALVVELIDAGRLRVEIAGRFPLAEAARAHDLVETGHTRGKVVLEP